MSEPFQLTRARQEELLSAAAAHHWPIVLTCRMPDGWATFKSRVLGQEVGAGGLVVEYPSSPAPVPEITAGQYVAVSFRHGHRKCAFNTKVQEQYRLPLGNSTYVPALRLEKPPQIVQLQRRLYHRAPVPKGVTIPVDVSPAAPHGAAPRDLRPIRGTMLDLSAGGISIALPAEGPSPCPIEGPVTCSFALEPGGPPAEFHARVRHCDDLDGDRVRIGAQFVGLDATPEGRALLRRVTRLATRFQRLTTRRHDPGL